MKATGSLRGGRAADFMEEKNRAIAEIWKSTGRYGDCIGGTPYSMLGTVRGHRHPKKVVVTTTEAA
jgi:hypothetical protein